MIMRCGCHPDVRIREIPSCLVEYVVYHLKNISIGCFVNLCVTYFDIINKRFVIAIVKDSRC